MNQPSRSNATWTVSFAFAPSVVNEQHVAHTTVGFANPLFFIHHHPMHLTAIATEKHLTYFVLSTGLDQKFNFVDSHVCHIKVY